MKYLHLILLSSALTLASCKTVQNASVSQDDQEVNIGYGTVKKDQITTPVSDIQVDSKESVTYSDMYSYLRGRVAGVEVRGKKITIRGASSINSSTEPLILLDGMAIEDLSIVNPNEVESVEVLKDSSASIYGVRGANGVILINTKKTK